MSYLKPLAPVIPEENYKPNIRPNGPEESPDPKWRAWRLMQQRPEIREILPKKFPDINRQLRELDLRKIGLSFKQDPPPEFFKPRNLEDLKGYKPIRLKFRGLPEVFRDYGEEQQRNRPRKVPRPDEEDSLPMEWLEEITQGLFARVWAFCNDTFGRECFGGRVDERDWTDFVLRRLPTDFLNCASEIARGDPVRHPKLNDPHSYEHLFLAKNERIFLMIGTISKLLKTHVFDKLLFGALEEEAETLKLQDKTTAHVEDGYPRKFARATLIRQYFTSGRDLEPQNFWEQVDRVTMGILDLILPMINFLGGMSPHTAWPTLIDVHQNLHHIVAEAAKLTNGLGVCRSVCRIEYPVPGDTWDLKNEHISAVIYAESERRTKDLDAEFFSQDPGMRDWAIRRADAEEIARQRWPAQAAEAWIDRWESANLRPVDPSRRVAKVQIVLWPSFTTHFPIKQNTAHGGDFNVGEERHTLSKTQVVYYSGRSSDEGEKAEDFTLLQHIRSHDDLVDNREIALFESLGHYRHYVSNFLTRLFIALLLLWLLTVNPLSQRFGSPKDLEITSIFVTEGTHTIPPAISTAVGTNISERSHSFSMSPSTSIQKWGSWIPFMGRKQSPNAESTNSTRSATPTPTGMESELAFTLSSYVPVTSTVTAKALSKSTFEASPKSTPDVSVTISEWTEPGEDNVKRTVAASPFDSTGKTTYMDIKSHKTTPSTKPKVVTKEDAVEHPILVTKPDSINTPVKLSSPPPPPSKQPSSATRSWEWLPRLFRGADGSKSDHPKTNATTQPEGASVKQEKTKLEPWESSSSESTSFSKVDLRSGSKYATDLGPLTPSSASSAIVADGSLSAKKLDAEKTSAETSMSSGGNLPVFGGKSPYSSPVTMAGPPLAAVNGDVESSPLSTTSDVWNVECASVTTVVRKWTDTRVKTYTERGQLVTVSEEIPMSQESLESVAPWHRRCSQSQGE